MSAKDLLVGDLPSDDEEGDSDYVTEDEGSSESEVSERDFMGGVSTIRAAKRFADLVIQEDRKLLDEEHLDLVVDPLWLALQKPVVGPVCQDSIEDELGKYCNITKDVQPVDVVKYKQQARQDVTKSSALAAIAREGLAKSKVEVSENVWFAGKEVTMKKLVDKSSEIALKYERKRQRQEAADVGLGAFQAYLDAELKSKRAVSSVEKSAADWNTVKMNTEGLEDALKQDKGFLEEKAFIHRADERQEDLRRESRRRKLDLLTNVRTE